MDRQLSSIARLAAVALLVGLAAVGCAGNAHSATASPAVSTPESQPSQAEIAASTPSASPTVAVTAGPTQSGGPTTAAGSTAAPAPTTDPLSGQLSNLDNLLNGIDSSISGGTAGASGGE